MPQHHRVDAVLEPFKHLVGTMTDAGIAELAGVSRSSVINYRRRHGIAAFDRRGGAGKPRGRTSVLVPFVHLLGVRSDAEVARLAGCSKDNVTSYRRRHGIASSVVPEVGALQGAASPSRPGSPPVIMGELPILAEDSASEASLHDFVCAIDRVPGLQLVRARDFATAARLAQDAVHRIDPCLTVSILARAVQGGLPAPRRR